MKIILAKLTLNLARISLLINLLGDLTHFHNMSRILIHCSMVFQIILKIIFNYRPAHTNLVRYST